MNLGISHYLSRGEGDWSEDIFSWEGGGGGGGGHLIFRRTDVGIIRNSEPKRALFFGAGTSFCPSSVLMLIMIFSVQK